MKQWILSVTFDVNGKGSYKVFYLNTEQECIKQAEQSWDEFYKIRDSNKHMLARYKNKQGTVQKEVKCDSVGHCSIF